MGWGWERVRVTWDVPGLALGPRAAPLTPCPAPPQLVSRGCETRELALPRDGQGRLGFEVDAAGFITHVERFTFAETTGLRPGAQMLLSLFDKG